MKSGRKSTPTAALRITGTFRADRHGERADAAPPAGEPVKPADLGDVEAALWDQVIPSLVRRKLAGECDTAKLVSMCELWGLYRRCYDSAKLAPTDKEVRVALLGYWGAFDRVASEFGLSATDLAGLKLPKEDGKKPVPTRVRA